MNPLVAKALPYLGYPLAAVMFFFWLNAHDAIIEEREGCNQDKLTSIAEAEAAARTAIQASFEQRVRDLEIEAQNERQARVIAEDIALEASDGLEDALAVNRRLTREASESENPTDTQLCLGTNNSSEFIDSMRD